MPEVDSLRACAALAVVAYHMDLLPVGWAGVWLFFVISGFVITRMLLGANWQLTAGNYVDFSKRRAARIWPLYFFYVSIAILLQRLWGDGQDLPTQLLALLTFTYDFSAASEAHFTIFHHLWTISVEQQFYLFYPFVFAAARRWRTARPVIAVIVIAFLMRIAEWLLASGAGTDSSDASRIIFYWSFGQFDAFGVGALIAFHADAFRRPAVHRAVLFLAAAVALGIVAVDVATNTSGRGTLYALAQPFIFPTKLPAALAMPVTTYVVVVAASAAMLVTAIGPETVVRRALRWPPLVGIGRISYGLYVWHMIVIVGMFGLFGTSFGQAPLSLRVALLLPCLGLSLGIAYLSYSQYEIRFHRRIGTSSGRGTLATRHGT